MAFKPWTKITYWMLAAFIAAGFLLRPLLGTVVNITTLLGEEYTVSSFTGDGVNMFRVLVCNVPMVLSFLYRKSCLQTAPRWKPRSESHHAQRRYYV